MSRKKKKKRVKGKIEWKEWKKVEKKCVCEKGERKKEKIGEWKERERERSKECVNMRKEKKKSKRWRVWKG